MGAAAKQELGTTEERAAPSGVPPALDPDSPSPVLSTLAGMARARLAASGAAVQLVGGMTFEGSPVNVVFCDAATGLPIEVPADLSTISREKLEGLGIRAAARQDPAARDSELQVRLVQLMFYSVKTSWIIYAIIAGPD